MRSARWLLVACLLGSVACATLLGIEDATPRVGDGGATSQEPCDGASCVPTCVAALDTDPKNCGRCDHDCLGGGCEAGACTPGVLLEAAQLTPAGRSFTGAVRVAEGKVLWTDRENDSAYLRVCAVDGCVPELLALQLAQVPVVQSAQAYFAAETGKAIDAVTLDGGVASRTAVRDFTAEGAFVEVVGKDEVASALFYDSVRDRLNHELRSCSVPGCTGGTTIAVIDGGAIGWSHAFADEQFVYAKTSERNGLIRCPKQGCNGATKQLGTSLSAPLAVAGKKVVGTRAGNKVLVSCTLPECTDERDLRSEPDGITAVATDGTHAYWSTFERVITRCRLDDCSTTEMLYRGGACDLCGAFQLGLANGILVWAEPDRLYRLVLP